MTRFLSNIRDFIDGKVSLAFDRAGQPVREDLKIGAVLLLNQAAAANGKVSPDEFNAIIMALSREFELSDIESAELVQTARLLADNKEKSEQLIAAIASAFDVEQKQKITSLVWKVLAADGATDFDESAFAAEARKKLGLTLEQAAFAQRLTNLK